MSAIKDEVDTRFAGTFGNEEDATAFAAGRAAPPWEAT
jgi:hypothetical protein